AAALVQFESGATGVLATVRAAPMYWRIMVFGSKGSAEARDETMLTVAKIGEQPVTQVYPAAESLGVLLESFAETIETGKPFPVCRLARSRAGAVLAAHSPSKGGKGARPARPASIPSPLGTPRAPPPAPPPFFSPRHEIPEGLGGGCLDHDTCRSQTLTHGLV